MGSLKGRKIRDTLDNIVQIDKTTGIMLDGHGNVITPTFSSSTTSVHGFTGSLTKLQTGESYIVAGNNISVVTSSHGQITINASVGSGTGADVYAPFVVVANTASLPNERALAAGSGLFLADSGAGGNVTLAADGTVARISGSRFGGNITATGTGSFESGLSGSLTKLTDGTSYIIAGQNITVTSASNGGVTVSGIASTKAITIENPTATEDITMFYTDTAVTITKMTTILIQSNPSPSVTWTLRHATDRTAVGNEVVTNGSTTINTTTGSVITAFSDPTVAANSFLWLETTASVNTSQMNLTIKYTTD